MNNNFYILPNKEGYLVKTCDNNSEIALFKNRNDAEMFIESTISSLKNSFSDKYNNKIFNKLEKLEISISQYFSQLQQFISTHNINSTFLPQVFFVQSSLMAQQISQLPYSFYSMIMPPILSTEEINYDANFNCYKKQNNDFNINCFCKYNNSNYNKSFEIPFSSYIKNIKDFKSDLNNLNDNLYTKKNNELKDNKNIPLYENDEYKKQSIKYYNKENNSKIINKNNQNKTILNKKNLNQQDNDISIFNIESETLLNSEQKKNEQNNNSLQEENNKQNYFSNSNFSNPDFYNKNLQKLKKEKQLSSIELIDNNNFLDFIKNKEFNNNYKISKKEIKKLMKKKIKEMKIQKKIRKYNNKKI